MEWGTDREEGRRVMMEWMEGGGVEEWYLDVLHHVP